MQKIDAHQHFWKFDPVRDSWITDDMSVIQKDFLPDALYPLLQKNNFNGCVIVQSDQSEMENIFQVKNAEENDFVKGIVGWVDLQSELIEERLAYYQSFKKMKGFRHVLQGESDRALMLRPAFKNGISLLNKYNFTYDILIFPDQLKYSSELVKAFPDQPFVIDHIAKPDIKNKNIEEWKRDIYTIAQYENVYCKISGMVSEAGKDWKKEDFTPYIDIVAESFGPNRIMFGSDWPVCLVHASFDEVVNIAEEYFSAISKNEQELFFAVTPQLFINYDFMDLQLKDKVIIVTGGAKGIGAGISKILAAENAIPVIVGRSLEDNKKICDEIEASGYKAFSVEAELANPIDCETAIKKILEKFDHIDGLVNNAGVNDGVGLENGNYEKFMESLHKNVVHYYLMAHFALPYLIKSKGSIVNITSKTAETGQGNTSAYAAANGGRNALTREWAVELLKYAIRVNAVVVAESWTPAYEKWIVTLPNPKEKLKEITDKIPFENRMTTPEEIANMVAFLLSGRSSHTTGQIVHVDGGYVHLDRALANA